MKNLLTGRWNLLPLDEAAGWTLLKARAGSGEWEFIELQQATPLFPGVLCHEGILLEWCGKHVINRMEYVYYPIENELFIDRSDIAPDGFVRVCCEDRYRVEPLDDHTLRLLTLSER